MNKQFEDYVISDKPFINNRKYFQLLDYNNDNLDMPKFKDKRSKYFDYTKVLKYIKSIKNWFSNLFLLLHFAKIPVISKMISIKEIRTDVILDSNNTVFVFNPVDENSLFAAAVVKLLKLGSVVTYGPNFFDIDHGDKKLCWLGFQPNITVIKQIKNSHVILLADRTPAFYTRNSTVLFGNFKTVTEQLLGLFTDKLDEETLSQLNELSNHSFLVNEFHKEKNNFVSDNKKFSRELKAVSEAVIIKGYSLIKQAYNFLYYQAKFDLSIMSQSEFKQDITDAKFLIDNHSIKCINLVDGYLLTEYDIEMHDYRWFMIKRLIVLSGQRLKLPKHPVRNKLNRH